MDDVEQRPGQHPREERKLHISATAHTRDGLELIAEATATFIVIPIERFMPGFTEVQE